MKYKEILNEKEAQTAIASGIAKAVALIAPTLGVKGRKIVLDKEYTQLEIIDDGAHILREIELPDRKEQMGVKILQEVANRTNESVGDGTTTSSILAHGLVSRVVGVEDTAKIKQELQEGVKKVIDFIDKNKIPIDPKNVPRETIQQIGTISANNPVVGKIIADFIDGLGKDVAILVSDGRTRDIESEIVKGFRFNQGYLAPAMVTNPVRGEAILEDTHVLVTDYKLNELPEFAEVLEKIAKEKINKLLIVADDISGLPLEVLIINKMQGSFNSIGVKAPVVGDAKEYLRDIAVLTGATLISRNQATPMKDFTVDWLGKADKVISTSDSTTILGGHGDEELMEQRYEFIEQQIKNLHSEYDKNTMNERLSRLRGGVGMIRVGGATELEINERKEKIDDAIHAVRSALEDGIVPGGGVMLLRASETLSGNEGELILKYAICEPFHQILKNAGVDPEKVTGKVLAKSNLNFGYDVAMERFDDLTKLGVVDPAKVTKTALYNALSIATMVLDTSGAVVFRTKHEEKNSS